MLKPRWEKCLLVFNLSSYFQHPQNLSSSLKERLQRSRRSFTSPFSVAKRLRVDEEEEEDGRQVTAHYRDAVNPSSVIDINRNVRKSGSEMICGAFPKATHPPVKAVAHELDQLRKEVKDKMETLRRLKMVKMYRNKVNPQGQNLCGWGPRFHGSTNHVLLLSLEWHDAAPELDWQVEELRSGGAAGAPVRRLHTWRKGEPVGADWPLWSRWRHSALWSFGGRFYLLNRSSKHTVTRTPTADVYMKVNIMFDSFGIWCLFLL